MSKPWLLGGGWRPITRCIEWRPLSRLIRERRAMGDALLPVALTNRVAAGYRTIETTEAPVTCCHRSHVKRSHGYST